MKRKCFDKNETAEFGLLCQLDSVVRHQNTMWLYNYLLSTQLAGHVGCINCANKTWIKPLFLV